MIAAQVARCGKHHPLGSCPSVLLGKAVKVSYTTVVTSLTGASLQWMHLFLDVLSWDTILGLQL